MSYLRIMNPGVCDYRCFTVLGVSGSRDDDSKIGQFGSGAKLGRNALLRGGITPIIFSGNLKMDFFFKPTLIERKEYRQVFVTLSGKMDDRNIKRNEDLQMTLEHGTFDWTSIFMGLREFVANALDSVDNPKDVTIDIVDEPRAKKGYTQVYIPYNDGVSEFVNILGDWFLQFSDTLNETMEVLPKTEPGPCKIYHKGVLIRTIGQNSVFDYNCPRLKIDESRNSDEWEVRQAIADTLIKHPNKLAQVIRETATNKGLVESTISSYCFCGSAKEVVAEAYQLAFGDDAVLCDNITENFVANKGYRPVQLSESFASVLRTVDRLKKDSDILNSAETSGMEVKPPTDEMVKIVDNVWSFFECLEMTGGKVKPKIQGMNKLMEGGGILMGQYCRTTKTVFINETVGGEQLKNTIVHEVAHHITGETDLSHSFADLGFSAIAKLI